MTDTPTDDALERHREACEANEPGYRDPDTGLFVMTSVYLYRQGECCGSGCRHCPWPDDEQERAGRPPEAPCFPYDERDDRA